MKMVCEKYSFSKIIPLLIAQTIGAFNDNAVKAFLPVLAAYQFGKESMDQINQWASLLLILPFILFAPLAGWVADRFFKERVIGVSLFSQFFGLSIIMLGISLQSLLVLLTGFFLLSSQSTFLSPAKKGILKEIVGYEKLGKAVGWMEMLSMVGILGGAFCGAILFDRLVTANGGWGAAHKITVLIFVLAIFSWLVNLLTPSTGVKNKVPFRLHFFFRHFQELSYLLKNPRLRWAALGDACFWAVGGFFYLVLVRLSGEVTEGNVGMGSLYGYWFLLLGTGIMGGAIFAAYFNRGRVEIGLSPIGLFGMTFSLVGIYYFYPLDSFFEICCVFLGFSGSLFFVPLNGYLQDQAEQKERGRILAASNLLTQLGGIGLIGVHAWLTNVLKMDAKMEILTLVFPLGILALIVSFFLLEDLLRACFHMLLHIFYRIEVEGMENFPERGGVLIVSNHLSYADPVFIGAAFPRKVRYLAHEELANNRFLKWIFRLTSTLMVSSKNSLFSVKQSIMRVATGTALCLFAEGGISRLGVTLPFKRGSILLAKYGKVPILPVFLDGVWGSVYSNHGGRFFKKIPQSFPYRVSVRVGNLIQPDEATNESLRQAVMELGRFSFKKQIGSPKQMRQRLHKQIFSSSDGILFRDLNGLEVTRKDFLQSIQSKHSKLPDLFNEWASQVVLFFDDQPDQTCLPWINWMRINQINLMDHPMLSIAKGNKVWTDQWFPWFPLLCGRGFEETKNGCWNMITEKEALQPHMVEGLATLSNGLVSIQLPDEISKTTNQLGTKKGTVGRILPGFSYVADAGQFIICGINHPEELEGIAGIDKDGFLVKEGN